MQAVDFVSDLHLCPDMPRTLAAFTHYLSHSAADAVVLLGDVFEVWVGDDSLSQSFEAHCMSAMRQAAARRPLGILRGNRDFLLGPAFFEAVGAVDLADPCALQAFGQTVLLTHGDAWCVADTEYQAFRAQVRQPAWQQQFLARPLPERLMVAQQMREASQAHQQQQPVTWADVDPAIAAEALQQAGAHTLVHGHTHRPVTEPFAGRFQRHVLSDWDLDRAERAEVLRWTAGGWQRLGGLAA